MFVKSQIVFEAYREHASPAQGRQAIPLDRAFPSYLISFLTVSRKVQPRKPLQRNSLQGHSVVGCSLLVGVIRP